MPLRVVDVSSHNGVVNWQALKDEGIEGAIIKATEGTDYFNPFYNLQLLGARNFGFVIGHYHFNRASNGDAPEEAGFFSSRADVRSGEIIANDTEDTNVYPSRDLRPWTHQWAAVIQTRYRVLPWLYSGYWYMLPHKLLSLDMGRYPLWYASYQDQLPPVPTGWDRITCWQHTSKLEVAGSFFDESYFYGTREDWIALGALPALSADPAVQTTLLDVRQWAVNVQSMLSDDKSQGDWVDADFHDVLLPAIDGGDIAAAITYLERLSDWCTDLGNTFAHVKSETGQQLSKLYAVKGK